MKKLCINISLFFMLLTLSSCNDWLDEVKQTTTVSDEITVSYTHLTLPTT